MSVKSGFTPAATLPDEDNPEWTRADFARARPATDMLPELLGAELAAQLLRKRGRPRASQPKVALTLRLDAWVVAQFKASGPGWQTRMNAALNDWLRDASLKQPPQGKSPG